MAVAMGEIEPILEGKVFVHPGDGTGGHQSFASGDHPGAWLERFATAGKITSGVGGFQEPEFAARIFEEPERDEAEFGGKTIRELKVIRSNVIRLGRVWSGFYRRTQRKQRDCGIRIAD